VRDDAQVDVLEVGVDAARSCKSIRILSLKISNVFFAKRQYFYYQSIDYNMHQQPPAFTDNFGVFQGYVALINE
jgi:hypothetical protein